ncbi:hypothetical protein V6N13_122387 [Hibiscus sabdariffa]|uniref:Uncharacterized protein n=2 Tax=Hibiscus sabdariffa TaxID=183260 RepID=A0ABR1ZEI5_9ROSI
MRFILGLSLVALLLLVSQSHPTAAVHVSMAQTTAVVEHASFQPRKLGVYIRRGGGGARGGGGGGGGRFVRGSGGGRSSSSAVSSHISSFHLASILGCSLFLVIFLL